MINKTPIQELIDCYEDVAKNITDIKKKESYEAVVIHLKNRGLEKEKAFAFDCYQAGFSEMWEDDSRTMEEDFDLFYLQFENHE